jgi:hypothetical protein
MNPLFIANRRGNNLRTIGTAFAIALTATLLFAYSSWAQQAGSTPATGQTQDANSQHQSDDASSNPSEQSSDQEGVRENQRRQERAADRDERRGEQSLVERAARRAAQAWMGVRLRNQERQEGQKSQAGVLVARVYPSGPAARAGVFSGDIITEVEGKRVTTAEELMDILGQKKPKERIDVVLLSGEQLEKVQITLGDRASFFPNEDYTSDQGTGDSANDEDDISDSLEFAMRLEQERHACLQRQRIEELVLKLSDEVRVLREEVQQLRGGAASANSAGRNAP